MIPLLKERLFLSLANNIKQESFVPVVDPNLSLKNVRRINKYRKSKTSNSHIDSLRKELDHHKKVNARLHSDVSSLKSTVDVFSSTIQTHDVRSAVAHSIIEKKAIIKSLRFEIKNLKEVAFDAFSSNEISKKNYSYLLDYISKIEKILHQKEVDITASMLL